MYSLQNLLGLVGGLIPSCFHGVPALGQRSWCGAPGGAQGWDGDRDRLCPGQLPGTAPPRQLVRRALQHAQL